MERAGFSATLDKTKDGALLCAAALALLGVGRRIFRALARRFEFAKIGFVGFDYFAAAAHWFRARLFHRLTDAVSHEPGRAVAAKAKGPHKLVGTDAFLVRGHEMKA